MGAASALDRDASILSPLSQAFGAGEEEVPAGADSTRSSLLLLHRSEHLAGTGSVEKEHADVCAPRIVPNHRATRASTPAERSRSCRRGCRVRLRLVGGELERRHLGPSGAASARLGDRAAQMAEPRVQRGEHLKPRTLAPNGAGDAAASGVRPPWPRPWARAKPGTTSNGRAARARRGRSGSAGLRASRQLS